MRSFLLTIIGSLFLLSCGTRITSMQDLTTYLNDTDNGYVKSRTIGNKKITVKYLPREYLQLRNGKVADASQEHLNRYFLLSIGYTENKGDIMYDQVYDMNEFAGRSQELNFRLDQYLKLKVGDKEFYPVLTSMENTYGLQSHRNFMVVFSPQETEEELYSSEELIFTFDDPGFQTGVNHFQFNTEEIDQELNIKI